MGKNIMIRRDFGAGFVEEANTCIHLSHSRCTKCGEVCPSRVRYDDDNKNNVPCDLVSYTPRKEK